MGTANLHVLDSVREYGSFVIPCMDSYELGTKKFADLLPDLNAIRAMLDEMIAIADTAEDITPGLAAAVDRYINDFSNVANYITLYDMDSDALNNYELRANITNDINNWITAIYTGSDANHIPYGFMPLYNALKIKALANVKTQPSVLEKLMDEVRSSAKKAQELVALLQIPAGQLTPYDYSAMIQNQAMQRSRLKIAKKSTSPFIAILQFLLVAFLLYAVGYILIVFYR